MTYKNLILGFAVFFIFAFLVGQSSAAVLQLTEVSIPSSTVHNSDVTISFELEHTKDTITNQTGLNWSKSTISGATFKSLPTLDKLDYGEKVQLSAVISVPQYSSQTVSFTIKVESATGSIATLQDSISVSSSESLIINQIKTLKLSQNASFKVKNIGNVNLNNIALSVTSPKSDVSATLSTSSLSLNAGAESSEITLSSSSLSSLNFGDNIFTLKAEDSVRRVSATSQFNVAKSFCSNGEVGSLLKISSVSIDNDGEGDETEWFPFDEITVEVDVENNGNDDIDDVMVEIGLFDSAGSNVIKDVEFIENTKDEEEFDLKTLKDGEEDTATFKFRIKGDLDEDTYKLVVKAYSDDLKESNLCADTTSDFDNNFYESISVEQESDEGKFIKFTDIKMSSLTATCGDTILVDTSVVNIGDEDQDRVKVSLSNRDLDLDIFREITSDLDSGDSDKVSFSFVIPQNAKNGKYDLELYAEYGYDDGEYEESSDETEDVELEIIGCGLAPGSGNFALIDASLESEAKANSELVIKSTIKNEDTKNRIMKVSAEGYETWGELKSISEEVFELEAGKSKELTITFDVNEEISGRKSFKIKLNSGSDVQTRDIGIVIEADTSNSEGFSLSSLLSGDNKVLWIIGLVNVILVALIILVAVRVSRR